MTLIPVRAKSKPAGVLSKPVGAFVNNAMGTASPLDNVGSSVKSEAMTVSLVQTKASFDGDDSAQVAWQQSKFDAWEKNGAMVSDPKKDEAIIFARFVILGRSFALIGNTDDSVRLVMRKPSGEFVDIDTDGLNSSGATIKEVLGRIAQIPGEKERLRPIIVYILRSIKFPAYDGNDADAREVARRMGVVKDMLVPLFGMAETENILKGAKKGNVIATHRHHHGTVIVRTRHMTGTPAMHKAHIVVKMKTVPNKPETQMLPVENQEQVIPQQITNGSILPRGQPVSSDDSFVQPQNTAPPVDRENVVLPAAAAMKVLPSDNSIEQSLINVARHDPAKLPLWAKFRPHVRNLAMASVALFNILSIAPAYATEIASMNSPNPSLYKRGELPVINAFMPPMNNVGSSVAAMSSILHDPNDGTWLGYELEQINKGMTSRLSVFDWVVGGRDQAVLYADQDMRQKMGVDLYTLADINTDILPPIRDTIRKIAEGVSDSDIIKTYRKYRAYLVDYHRKVVMAQILRLIKRGHGGEQAAEYDWYAAFRSGMATAAMSATPQEVPVSQDLQQQATTPAMQPPLPVVTVSEPLAMQIGAQGNEQYAQGPATIVADVSGPPTTVLENNNRPDAATMAAVGPGPSDGGDGGPGGDAGGAASVQGGKGSPGDDDCDDPRGCTEYQFEQDKPGLQVLAEAVKAGNDQMLQNALDIKGVDVKDAIKLIKGLKPEEFDNESAFRQALLQGVDEATADAIINISLPIAQGLNVTQKITDWLQSPQAKPGEPMPQVSSDAQQDVIKKAKKIFQSAYEEFKVSKDFKVKPFQFAHTLVAAYNMARGLDLCLRPFWKNLVKARNLPKLRPAS